MRTVNFEHLRPGEIIAEQNRKSIIYLPLGPLEWHTPALPYGTDGFIAHEVACRSAEITGGVVLPTLFLGSDCPRSEEQLRNIGFSNTTQHIIGMDFPDNTLKSLYMGADVVSIVIKEHLRLLVRQGYKLIVLLSAHGAQTQGILIDEICKEFTDTTGSKVINGLKWMLDHSEMAKTIGHANISEASLMMYLTDDVELSELPDKNIKLKYTDWGILDASTIDGKDSGDHCVIHDPRDGSPELGKKYFDSMVEGLSASVIRCYGE